MTGIHAPLPRSLVVLQLMHSKILNNILRPIYGLCVNTVQFLALCLQICTAIPP